MADEVKQGEIRVAGAERDKVVQVANATKQREIGTREASASRRCAWPSWRRSKRSASRRRRSSATSQVKQAEQAKRIAMAEANAKAVDGENIADAKIAQSQATLLVQKAEAYERGEGRKREAEAAVIEVQNRAMAKAALAEAERVEAEQRAKLEAPAKAQKARIVVDAEAEAEKRRLEAEGEAAAIFAKLEAEARGQYEILAKKGEGLKQIVEACGGAQAGVPADDARAPRQRWPKPAPRRSATSSSTRSSSGKTAAQNGRSNTADFLHKMAGTLPPMMQVMRDIGGVEIPTSLAKLVGEDGAAADGNGQANGAAQSGRWQLNRRASHRRPKRAVSQDCRRLAPRDAFLSRSERTTLSGRVIDCAFMG